MAWDCKHLSQDALWVRAVSLFQVTPLSMVLPLYDQEPQSCLWFINSNMTTNHIQCKQKELEELISKWIWHDQKSPICISSSACFVPSVCCSSFCASFNAQVETLLCSGLFVGNFKTLKEDLIFFLFYFPDQILVFLPWLSVVLYTQEWSDKPSVL